MKILSEIYSEDCFDGNFIKEYKLDKKVDSTWVKLLEKFGKITVLDSLERPFYSFDKKYFFAIKGILNENKIKVVYRRDHMDLTKDFLNALIESDYKESKIKDLKAIEKNIIEKIEK